MGKETKLKKKTKVIYIIIILFSVIHVELVILNMHIKFEVSNSYTD